MYCRVCNSKVEKIDVIRGNCFDTTSYYDHLLEDNISEINLDIYRCNICGHIQIKEILGRAYYDDYSISYGENEKEETAYPEELLRYYDKCFKEIKKSNVLDKALDIGCGSGEMLGLLKKYFGYVKGIEPSKNLAEKALKKGFDVVNNYFNVNVDLNHKFGFITCLMVLEHINELNDFIKSIYNYLDEGGIAMINVPNGSKIFEESSYYDVFPEHINYFTEKSLMELAWKNGLHIMHLEEIYGNGYHMVVLLRKPIRSMLFSEKKKVHITEINNILQGEGDTVGIWGIGVRAGTIIKTINKENILKVRYLFDRNVSIEGKMISNINIPITLPEVEKIKECDIMVISSLEYCDEIIKTLYDEYHFRGKICYVNKGNFVCIRA